MPLMLRENLCRAHRLPRNDDILMGRAQLLEAKERELVEAILIRGQTAASVGRMMGISQRVVRNRISRIGRRLTSRRFLDAARALAYLAPDDRELVRLRFCHGATQRELAERFLLSPHMLRRRLDGVIAQIKTVRRMSHPASRQRGGR
ncbi:MAG: hypothetical protein KAU28_09545 [Phycisphaerae bacterium]|nr:hypothetical protein [Phycisphaerae bacterium]